MQILDGVTKSVLSVHCGGVYGEGEDKEILVSKVSRSKKGMLRNIGTESGTVS